MFSFAPPSNYSSGQQSLPIISDDASRKGSPPRQKPINNEEVEFKESKVPAMGDERVSEEDQFEEEVERVSSTFSERSSFDMKDMKARTVASRQACTAFVSL